MVKFNYDLSKAIPRRPSVKKTLSVDEREFMDECFKIVAENYDYIDEVTYEKLENIESQLCDTGLLTEKQMRFVEDVANKFV